MIFHCLHAIHGDSFSHAFQCENLPEGIRPPKARPDSHSNRGAKKPRGAKSERGRRARVINRVDDRTALAEDVSDRSLTAQAVRISKLTPYCFRNWDPG